MALTIWDIEAFARTVVSHELSDDTCAGCWNRFGGLDHATAPDFQGVGSEALPFVGARFSFPSSLIYPGAHFCGSPRRPGFVGA